LKTARVGYVPDVAELDAALLRSLAAARSGDAAALTCYLDLDPAVVPTAAALSSHVTALVREARHAAEEWSSRLGHDEALRLREDVDRVERFLVQDLDRTGAHGLALFVCGPRTVWHEVRLPDPVGDAIHVGRSFVVAPLLPHADRHRDVVVAAVGRDRGSIWRLRGRRVVESEDLSRDGQGQHDQGGWSQARYARAREKEALDHLRGVANALAEHVREGSGTLLAVACVEERRTGFDRLLGPHVRDALIGWVDYEAHADVDALLPDVERLLDEHRERERAALLDRWQEERGQASGLATERWPETLAAAADGRVEVLLVDRRTERAYECPSCGRGSLEPGLCELDGAPLEEAGGGARELAVRSTLANGGQVRMLPEQLQGAPVAAVLRYSRPAQARVGAAPGEAQPRPRL
jgi:peptide chain release factor subunit 1